MVWASGPTPASRFSAWLNKQYWAGREMKRGGEVLGECRGDWCSLRLGGPDARGTEGAFFVSCRQNGSSCCCLGASACPRVRLYRIPHLSTTSLPPPLSQSRHRSLTHPRPSIFGARSAGGVQCFVDARRASRRPARGRENF